MKRIKEILGGVVNYLAALGIGLVFALYMSGRVGWFLVAAFAGAPVISVLMTLPFLKRISVTADADVSLLPKGDSCELIVSVSSDFFLPSPLIRIELSDTPNMICNDPSYTVSVLPYSSESFVSVYKASICGPCGIGVSSVRISDFLGIFSFEIKTDREDILKNVAIIPDIADIQPDASVITAAAILSADADDSEDTVENPFASFNGFPGYNSRAYVPGDPLKRINWKQSAKKGELLVRLDDETSCSTVSIVLDTTFACGDILPSVLMGSSRFPDATEKNIFPKTAEAAVENSLGLIRAFLQKSCTVNFLASFGGEWRVYSVADEGGINELVSELAAFSFSTSDEGERFPQSVLEGIKGSVCIFSTPWYDDTVRSALNGYISGGNSKGELRTVVYAAAVSPLCDHSEEEGIYE